MTTMEELPLCVEKLANLITMSKNLLHICQENRNIFGISKLEQKIKSEQKFLLKLEKHSNNLKKFHLSSTNLIHLNAIVKSFINLPNVITILQTFNCPTFNFKLTVDIVCNNGATWIKVVARNSKALIAESLGQKDFGDKTLVDQAIELYELSKYNLHYFKRPNIVFIFVHSIPKRLAKRLKACNIYVTHFSEVFQEEIVDLALEPLNSKVESSKENNPLGNIELNFYTKKCCLDNKLFSNFNYVVTNNLDLSKNRITKFENSNLQQTNSYTNKSENKMDQDYNPNLNFVNEINFSLFDAIKPSLFDVEWCKKDCICHSYMDINQNILTDDLYSGLALANLDITALMALVSNLSHGSTNHNFKTEVLRSQATEEKSQPVLAQLVPFLRSRKLVACKSALIDFEKILDFVGGANERHRALQLMKCLYIVEDKELENDLRETSRMSKRAWTIFSTGHQLRAVTVTANKGFIRAAHQMKYNFVAFIHDARALTESKENSNE